MTGLGLYDRPMERNIIPKIIPRIKHLIYRPVIGILGHSPIPCLFHEQMVHHYGHHTNGLDRHYRKSLGRAYGLVHVLSRVYCAGLGASAGADRKA